MGLDMYAYSRAPGADKGSQNELAYWRKHNRLHGWMERLYESRGGTEEFNCVELLLSPADIDALEMTVNAVNPDETMPPVVGFFFGGGEYDAQDKADDLAFIEAAREAHKQGLEVYYDSWW